MLTNLRKEMLGHRGTIRDLAQLLEITEQSASNKLSEVTDFTFPEAEKIKQIMFPEFTYEYLFASDTTTQNEGSTL